MSFTTMTIADLCLSPFNVRQNAHDANAVEGMAESLLSRGQLYPLVVHPMPAARGRKKQWGALAGGRRYRAFKLLIDSGRLPANHPIEVITRDITDEAELVDLSLAENLVRVELRPYEVYAAVARAHMRGRSLKDIADTNGQTVETVRRWARLGNLHPEIFAALERGDISQDQAKAFAATEDQDLQLSVWAQLTESPARANAYAIRRLLKIGDSDLTLMLHFVGEAAYAKAGGRYELDLFADDAEARGRVVDEGLLAKLVEEKLERTRALLRRQTGREDLRFERDYPRDKEYGGIARDLEISAEPRPASDEDAERCDYLKLEMVELEARAQSVLDDGDLDQAARDRLIAEIDQIYLPMEQEVAAIGDRMHIELPAGDVFATLVIEPDGELEVRFWWANRKERRKAEKAADKPEAPMSAGPLPGAHSVRQSSAASAPPPTGSRAIDRSYYGGERQKADAAIREQYGLSADGIVALRSIRREVLRAGLIDAATSGSEIGLDFAIWTLTRFELGKNSIYCHDVGARRLAGAYSDPSDDAENHVGRTKAHQRWENAIAFLAGHSCMVEKDLIKAFQSYRGEDGSFRRHCAAVLAGLMLERSLNAGGYQVSLHDLLADECELDAQAVHDLAEPTEELVELFPRAARIAMAEPLAPPSASAKWGKLKAAELVRPVTDVLRKARDWCHPLVRFDAGTLGANP